MVRNLSLSLSVRVSTITEPRQQNWGDNANVRVSFKHARPLGGLRERLTVSERGPFRRLHHLGTFNSIRMVGSGGLSYDDTSESVVAGR